MGLDLGTTGVKAISFTPEGKVLARAYQEYEELYPRPEWVEMDPEKIWRSTKHVIRQVALNTKKDPIQAIGLSVLGEAVTPIGKDGKPLYNSITAVDRRSIEETRWLERNLEKKHLFQITGMPPHPSYSISKILWIKNNRPDIFEKTWKFLLYEDFILHKLGIEPAIDYSLAARTMAFNIHTKDWSSEILQKIGIDKSMFAKAYPSGEVVGKINPLIAKKLGLSTKTVAVLGGHDQPVSALGAGIIEEGKATDTCGTVECVTCISDKLDLPEARLTYSYATYPYVVEGKFVTIAYFYTAGALLKWYRDNFAFEERKIARKEKKDIYEVIIGQTGDDPSPLLLLPHFMGSGTPWFDPLSKGAIVGLTLGTDRRDIVKAILDSVGYELRVNLEFLEKSGVKVKLLHAIGGGARSEKWLQIKADITGRVFRSLKIPDAACLGAAILAGRGIGVFSSVKEGIQEMVRYKKEFIPRRERQKRYENKYRVYRRLYKALKKINSKLI